MASSERTIRVVIDSSQARAGAAQVNAALGSIGTNANNSSSAMARANMAMTGMNRSASGLGSSMRAANNNFKESNNSILNMARSLGKATLAVTGLTALTGGVAALGVAFTGAADKAAQLEGKLRNATKSQADYAAASSAVQRIANETRGELTAVGDLYAKMSRNAATLGINTTGVGIATKTFSQVLAVGSATATQAQSAILQLGQAMSKGLLNGDEFTSLSENATVFMEVLAKSMNISVGALKALGAQGKITGKDIAKALTDPKIVADIERQFGRIPITFENVKTAVSNAMINISGALVRGLGISDSLAGMIANIQTWAASAVPYFEKFGQQVRGVFNTIAPVLRAAFAVVGPIVAALANNLESVTKVALSVGAGFLVMKASMGLSSVIAETVRLGVTMGASGGAAAFFTGAMTSARVAVNGLTLAIAANPIGFLVTALTVGITLLAQFSDKIKLPGQEFGRLNDIIAVWWRDTTSRFKAIVNSVMTFGTNVKKVFDAFAVVGRAAFNAVVNVARGAFSRLDALTGGWLGRFMGFMSKMIQAGSVAWNWFSQNFSRLPGIIGGAIGGAVNSVIGAIENMVNAGINGLNRFIAVAKTLPGGGGLSTIGNISIARVGAGPNYGQDSEARGRARENERLRTETKWDFSAYNTPRPDPLASGATMPSTGGGSGNTGANDAADAAKRQAEAIRDYWAGLEQSRDSAGLLGVELERHNAALEYRKLLGEGDLANTRALTEAETTRINGLLQETENRKLIAELTQTQAERARETNLLQQRGLLIGTMTNEQLDNEMAVREHMGELRAKAILEGKNLNDANVAAALALEEASLRDNLAVKEGNRLRTERLQLANALAETYDRRTDPAGFAASQRTKRDEQIAAITARPGESPDALARRISGYLEESAEDFSTDLNEISQKWRDEMLEGVDQIANAFGGEIGDIISKLGRAWDAIASSANGDQSKSGLLGGISRLFGGANGSRNAFGQAVDSQTARYSPTALMDTLRNPAKALKESSEAFKSMWSGGLVKGLGSAVGNAIQGANIGAAIGGVGKAIFKDAFSSTGSSIGGMLGSLTPLGPIGGMIGSVLGGFIGGIFGKKKAATGSSSITMGANGLVAATSGNNAAAQGEAGQASAKVIEGITAIAARLGVDATGMSNVSIGKYKNEWKVGTSGQAVGKKSGQSFGEDAEAAIRFAIQDAIRDGVLVGLSSFSDRLLKSSSNLDSALSLAESYEKLLKDLGGMKDPLGASIKSVTDNLDKMVKMMVAAGATSEELGKVEEYKRLKLDEILKSSLSSLYDFKKELNGEGSGVTAMDRLSAAQSDFARLQAQVLAGNAVDQNEFTSAGQTLFGLAREVFGTSSSQFQAIREALIAATDGAITNVNTQFGDAQVVAIQQQTDAVTTNQVITNDLLTQMLNRMGQGGRFDGGSDVTAVNGRAVINSW